ncbi:hypothetical protein [Geminocystis sp. GBBB08]|uniref:hypothetical protein n=1 Tax=Geminocystis sp. GBBB08 TaxID=2604140 RepID=UPI0027E2B5B1|nr:hypothetical protein [Geminocystis sp. GBBB08]MBL1208716.1 hypothetical protein [Geminocystis sp. GBBB08]
MKVEKDQIITAVKGLTRRVNIKQKHLEIIDQAIGYNKYKKEEWEEILNSNNINLALNNKIYTMEMVRLLTLRAIVNPDTIIEYFTWLSEGQKQNKDALKYAFSFQEQVYNISQNTLNYIDNQLKSGIRKLKSPFEAIFCRIFEDRTFSLAPNELELLKLKLLDLQTIINHSNSLWQTFCIDDENLFSKNTLFVEPNFEASTGKEKNKWFNFLPVYKKEDEFDKIDNINSLLILGYGSAYLPEYLPILSYLHKKFNHTNIQIIPIDDYTLNLSESCEYIFLEGLLYESLSLTNSKWSDIHDSYYSFKIQKKTTFNNKQIIVSIIGREFLEGMNKYKLEENEWLKDCFEQLNFSKTLFFFNGLRHEEDSQIAKSINNLSRYLSQYDKLVLKRIPVIFHHFDHPKLYPYKNDMNSFLKQRFPLTKNAFDEWGKRSNISIAYFSCSLFGIVKNNGMIESNGYYYDHYGAILKNPDNWKPFGILSPIYWLLTGRYDANFLDI